MRIVGRRGGRRLRLDTVLARLKLAFGHRRPVTEPHTRTATTEESISRPS
jgi:hypothetical protein